MNLEREKRLGIYYMQNAEDAHCVEIDVSDSNSGKSGSLQSHVRYHCSKRGYQ
jgi:hypothetical protein